MERNPSVWLRDSRQFLLEVRGEFRKVTWPSQKETIAGTTGVVIIVAVIATALGLVDFVLGQVIRLVVP